MNVSVVGGYPYAAGHDPTLIGYARCSTDAQDLTAQREALAAVRAGDTLIVPKLARLARNAPDAHDIGHALEATATP
ncbi:hypothetical protein [Actinocatenispora rupis]|uniref:Resolvase, N terminal domain n=1 Tax=Actinocatenispora rupis TaxID=519421 RepID=A0A8J3J9L5_9ACTN|nr:hypothetical protein [Actinocatenispora rupis]GID12609.1 hypothetical protein Aru02nite_34980 [Actinocatenispora rupis]